MSEIVLPEGWASINLERIANIILGQSPDGESVNELGQGIIFFQGKTEFGKIYPTPRKFCTSPKKIAEAGDILLSVRAPVGPTNFASQRCAIGRGLSAIRGFNGIDQFYLMYFFKSIEMWLSEQGTGTTFKAISGDFIREINVCIPPLAEQKVIADKLDSLLAQVDNIKTRLDALPTIIKRFKQSVLSAAVSGRLTEEWRIEHGVDFEFSEEKLAEIIFEMRNGLSTKPNEEQIGTPILRISSVRSLFVDQVDVRFLVLSTEEKERYSLKVEDLLFTRYNGSLDFVGVCGQIRSLSHHSLVYPDKLIRVRVNKQKVLPSYLELYCASSNVRQYITSLVKSTSGQKGISGQDLKEMLVKLPPLEEQTEIVRRVEQLFAYADQIEQQVKNAQSRVNNLTQSILAKAFRGELTADWRAANPHLISGENSAQALLAKIKAERDKPKKISKQQAMFNE